MLDPVHICAIVILFLAAIVFLYFASQGHDDAKYEKLAKESTRILLDKKGAAKGKAGKNKKDRKNEKRSPEAAGRAVDEEVTVKEVHTPESKVEKQSDISDEGLESANVSLSPGSTTTQEDAVKGSQLEQEGANGKKKQAKKGKESAKVPVPISPDKAPTPSPPAAEQRETVKPKKKRVVVADLNEHTLLSQLATVPDLDPEYISFLTHYFNEVNEKAVSTAITISALEKKVIDSSAKADQHCKERMTAQKECVEQKRVAGELSKKVAALEEEAVAARRLVAEQTTKISTFGTLQTGYAKLSAEATAMRQSDAVNRQKVEKLQHDLNIKRDQVEAAHLEISNLRSVVNAQEKELAKVAEEVASKNTKLIALQSEFEEIQLLARDAVAKNDVAAAGVLMNNASGVNEELQEKEANWMAERARLEQVITRLQQEIARFEERKARTDRLERDLREAEKKNDALQKTVDKLTSEIESVKALQDENKRLVAKNEELRERNMAVLAHFESSEASQKVVHSAQSSEKPPSKASVGASPAKATKADSPAAHTGSNASQPSYKTYEPPSDFATSGTLLTDSLDWSVSPQNSSRANLKTNKTQSSDAPSVTDWTVSPQNSSPANLKTDKTQSSDAPSITDWTVSPQNSSRSNLKADKTQNSDAPTSITAPSITDWSVSSQNSSRHNLKTDKSQSSDVRSITAPSPTDWTISPQILDTASTTAPSITDWSVSPQNSSRSNLRTNTTQGSNASSDFAHALNLVGRLEQFWDAHSSNVDSTATRLERHILKNR